MRARLALYSSLLRDWSHRLSPGRMFCVILLAGFCSRLVFVCLLQPWRSLARYEMERVALSLVNSGVLGNPYAIETGPSAHIAPLYAFLLAAIFYLFGDGTVGEIVKVCTSAFISVLPFALFPLLARSLGLGMRVGFWSGLVASLLPLKPSTDLLGDWEAPAAATLLVLCMIGVARTLREGRMNARWAAGLGFCWGIALLTAPALLSLYIVCLLASAVLFIRIAPRAWIRFAAIQTAVVALLLAPWALRNWIELGSPILTRSNLGLELRVSNNDLASASETLNSRTGVYDRYHPLQSASEAAKLRDLGEVEYNRRARAEALDWIRNHPARFLRLTVSRIALFWFFWFPKSDFVRSALFAVLSVASFAGAFLLLRRDLRAGLVLLIPLLVQPLPHYFVHVNVRYKYPIDWIGVIGIAIVIDAYLHRAARNAAPAEQRMETAANVSPLNPFQSLRRIHRGRR